jgi:hypothetical protein
MQKLKTFIKTFAFAVIAIPVLLIAVITMLFFSVFSFRSESAQQDVAAYKNLSDTKLSDGKKYLTEKKDNSKKYAWVMPQSGTTVMTVAWKGFQEIKKDTLG